MRIAVVGAGALGSLVAGLLAKAGAEVCLVGVASSAQHFAAVQAAGLRFDVAPKVGAALPPAALEKLKTPVRNLKVTQTPVEAYPCDLAVVLVKSYRTGEAARQVAQLLSQEGLALSLQNGLGNAELLRQQLGSTRVTQGVTLLGAGLPRPGLVFVASLSVTSLTLEPAITEVQRQYLAELKEYLQEVGAPVVFTSDVQSTVWGKLLINCAINPLAGLLDVTNGVLIENEASRQLMTSLVEEVVQVAKASDIELPFPAHQAPARAIEAARLTAANFCSMVQDLRRGSLTEIEALNGAVVRQAERVGVAVPINQTMAQLIRVRQSLGTGRS